MLDPFNRNITYLRISVTDRCNLRCTYCMPPGKNIKFMPESDVLSVHEIHEIVKALVPYGIRKIRLTGGEPLFRSDIVDIVTAISSIPEIDDIGLTTNGILLSKYAKALRSAGLKRVNISLDTLDFKKYAEITSGGNLAQVIHAIASAKVVGFDPIKINCVRTEGFSEMDKAGLENFCLNNALSLRFIRQMDLKKGTFWPVEGGDGGNCSICNRIRLTANGFFKPCLFSDQAYSVRENGIVEAFLLTINGKPERGGKNLKSRFSEIGG